MKITDKMRLDWLQNLMIKERETFYYWGYKRNNDGYKGFSFGGDGPGKGHSTIRKHIDAAIKSKGKK